MICELTAVASPGELADVVRARYADGPFVPTDDDGAAFRIVELCGSSVREHHATSPGLNLGCHLAYVVAAATREPVVVRTNDYCAEVSPDDVDRLGGTPRDATPIEPWQPTSRQAYALDVGRQRAVERRMFAELPAIVRALFPIRNRAQTARFDCKRVNVYGPSESYRPGIFRYDNSIQTDLQLALMDSKDDGDPEVRELLAASVTFCVFRALAPDGSQVYRGEPRTVAMDEYAAELVASMRRFKRSLVQRMNERTSWDGATVEALIDG